MNKKKKGLSTAQVQEKRKQYGYNELTEKKKKSIIVVFLLQFKDFLVGLLIAAAIISMVLGDMESALVILLVITMNAVLGTIQQKKAEQSLEGLKKLTSPKVKVIRDDNVTVLEGRELVPGDVVLFEAGDALCADGILTEAEAVTVNESALTGESIGVEKNAKEVEKSMVYSGCIVNTGRGEYEVIRTGMDTEVGKIANLVQTAEEKKTPLQISLDDFGKKLSIVIMGICALVFGVSVWQGQNAPDAFLFAVALAVAAIPEALSSIVTIVLAFCTRKMAKENAIVRKLASVESLGSVSVICTDKTGTLTQNKMTVTGRFTFDCQEKKALVYAGVLCNDAVIDGEKQIGDPTETALLAFAEKKEAGFVEQAKKKFARKSSIPFDSDRKLMTVLCEQEGSDDFIITKGAVDVLLDRLTSVLEKGQVRAITQQDVEKIQETNRSFSNKGLRVLAFGAGKAQNGQMREENLCFLGLMAMSDPPREESKESVALCTQAGILTVMITGDHPATAAAIAEEIGILEPGAPECVLTGTELEQLSEEQLVEKVRDTRVYARVSPEHKIRIVRAWQKLGMITSMTGDGVNDAPALKQADVGVAMGKSGTEAAKEAADMILADDNFATIVKAVESGRNIYGNIKKSIGFLLSGNMAGILCVLTACLAGMPLPFAPVHLLFINLLTDSLPAVALGMEPHSREVMKEKPRPANEGILTKNFMENLLIEGIVIAVNTMAAFVLGGASVYAFGVLCLSRLLHGYTCKGKRPVLGSSNMWNNIYMNGAFIAGFLLLNLVLLIPALEGLFQTVGITGMGILMIYGFSLLSFLENQLIRWIRGKIHKAV